MNKVLVLGGSGFVGRAFASAWVADARSGAAGLRIPSRRPARAKALSVLPGVEVVGADVNEPARLASLLNGCDAVVNLVAILHGDATRFEQTHVRLPERLLAACAQARVRRLVHVSALGVQDGLRAVEAAPSLYLRTKTQGEHLVRAAPGLAVTVLRPSVIFGAEDRFVNLFARLQALLPLMPLAGAAARFQPVWVEDVAHALVACLHGPATAGRTFEAVGPQVLNLADIVRAAGHWSGHPRPILPLPESLGRLQAAVLGLLPGEPLMSPDNLASMRVDNVASGKLPTLEALDIRPTPMATVMAPWLARGATACDLLRTTAGR